MWVYYRGRKVQLLQWDFCWWSNKSLQCRLEKNRVMLDVLGSKWWVSKSRKQYQPFRNNLKAIKGPLPLGGKYWYCLLNELSHHLQAIGIEASIVQRLTNKLWRSMMDYTVLKHPHIKNATLWEYVKWSDYFDLFYWDWYLSSFVIIIVNV